MFGARCHAPDLCAASVMLNETDKMSVSYSAIFGGLLWVILFYIGVPLFFLLVLVVLLLCAVTVTLAVFAPRACAWDGRDRRLVYFCSVTSAVCSM